MNFFSFILFVFLFVNTSGVFATPGVTTYQAKIVKPDGYPLESSNVSFRFTILDPAGSCILYTETYSSVNMASTGGLISFSLGSGVKTYPASATTFKEVFSNTTPSLSCDTGGPGTYSPSVNDTRKIVMQFHDGTGWQTLPAMAINAVPYAMYAGKSENATQLNGKSDSAFVEYSSLASLNCQSNEAIKFNGVSFSCIPVGVSSSGVSSVTTSGTVLTTGGTASAPVISITAASVSSDGYLTSLDYAEFKAKLGASSTQIINTLGYAPVSSSAVAAQISSSNLSGDVSGAISSNSVVSVGGKTASQISTSVDDTLSATASNTANTIVKRNSSGNFTANDIFSNSTKTNYIDIYKPSTSFNIRLQAPTSLAANYTLILPASSGTSGQVLSTDGAGNLSWINAATGSVTSVSGTTGEITSSGGATPVIGLTNTGTAGTYYKVITDSKGRVTSGATTLLLSDLPNTVLNTTSAFAGDISGIISNITVNRIQGVSVTVTSLTSNDILQYDGAKYVNKNIPTCTGSQYLTFNGTSFSCIVDAGSSGTITTLSVTGPLSSTGGSNPTLSIAQANSTTNGYLSSTDWNTFNNKQIATSAAIIATLGYTPADSAVSGAYAQKANNLSDLTSSATARSNLGLGTLATANNIDLGSASATGIIADARFVNQSNVTSGTQYTKVTVDGKGRVTSGAQLSSADVVTALGYTPGNSSSGVTALNGSASQTQSLANSLTGTTPAFLTANGVHTLNIPYASAGTTTAGLISNADYVNFSNKLSTLDLGSTSATGTLAAARLPAYSGDATSVSGSAVLTLSNSGVTSGTYTKVTVDTKGRVTSGTNLASSDVTTALGYTPASATASTQWTTSGSAIYYNSGNVGIGTANPVNPFQTTITSGAGSPYVGINQTADNPFIELQRWTGTGSNYEGVRLKNIVGSGGQFAIKTTQNGGAAIGSQTFTERMRIVGGNVGIGTTSPLTKLEVSGGVRISMESATCAASYAGTLRYNAGNVEYCNGTTWAAFGISGAGLQSFNGSTSGTQTFTNGTSGNAPAFVTSNGVHTLNIPYASVGTTTAGLISNADYTTFSNKITSSAVAIAQVLGYTPASATALGNYLVKTNNLSDLTSSATARSNLGLGALAVADTIDLGSASATGTLAVARLPAFTGDATIAAASNTIVLSNSGVTSGTYTKVTVDTKGRVTSGASLTSSDVTAALGYTPANSATTVSSQWNTSGTTINYMTGNVGIGTSAPDGKLEIKLANTTYNATITKQSDYGDAVYLTTNANPHKAALFLRGSDKIGAGIESGREDAGTTWKTYLAFMTNNLTAGANPVDSIQEKMRITADGNVGIGTTNPTTRLSFGNRVETIKPTIATYDDGAGAYYGIGTINSPSWALGFWTHTETTPKMVIGLNGNVGIGTTNPQKPLDVAGEIVAQGRLSLTKYSTLSTANSPTWHIDNNNDQFRIFRQPNLTTGGNAYMEITASGSVGIGATSPNAKLHITDLGNAANGILNLSSTSAGADGAIAKVGAYSYMNTDSAGAAYYNWGARYDGEANTWIRNYTASVNYLPYMALTTSNRFVVGGMTTSATTDTNPTMSEKFVVDVATGNVGIGTTTPTGKFQVAGSHANGIMTDTNDRPSVGVTGGYPQMVLMAGGTTNTSHGSTIMLGSYDAGTSGNHKHWSIGTAGQGSTFLDIGYHAGTDINPHAGIRNYSGSTFMTILNSGNVGIGTTSPISKFEVFNSASYISNGTGANTLLKNTSSANGDYLAIGWTGEDSWAISSADAGVYRNLSLQPFGGNVGIGTNSPARSLHVNGDAYINAIVGGQTNGSGNFHLDAWTSGADRSVYLNWYSGTGGAKVGNGSSNWGPISASAFNTSSDRRLKENIKPIANPLDKVLKLEPVTFTWKDVTRNKMEGVRLGLIAQNVEKIFPQAVRIDRGENTLPGGTKLVTYPDLVAPLIAAIKEFYSLWWNDSKELHSTVEKQVREIASLKAADEDDKTEIKSLKAKNEKLEQENAEMKARLDKIEKALNSK